jgi:hypothetical protein
MITEKTAHSILGVAGFLMPTHLRGELYASQTWQAERTKRGERLRVTLRFDDQCGNGSMDFSATAVIYDARGRDIAGGCCHDAIVDYFPKLAPLIKWHSTSTREPMHYVENAVYHARQHGPNRAYIYYTGASDPLNVGEARERLLIYGKADEAERVKNVPGYRVQWDEKTTKVRNLDHARSAAVWPEATDEELSVPEDQLRAVLLARLPALRAEFKRAMIEDCGFDWREKA